MVSSGAKGNVRRQSMRRLGKGQIAIVLVGPLVVLLSLSLPAAAINDWVCFNIPDAGYTDVSPNSPHRTDINCLKNLNITTQQGTYRPADYVTRGEMSLFLTRTVSSHHLPPQPSASFVDIGHLSPEMQLAIAQLVDLGISFGTTETTFQPSSSVPRWQMAMFLARTIHIMTGQVVSPSTQWFADLAGLSPEGVAAINWLRDIGIVAGTGPSTFSPFALVTREQMASFLIRTYKHIFVLPADSFTQSVGTCNADSTMCEGEINFPQGLPFGLREGIYSSYPFATFADEARFRAPTSVVYFTIDGVSVLPQVSEVVSGKTILRWYYTELPNGFATGTHTIEVQTHIEGALVSRYLLSLHTS